MGRRGCAGDGVRGCFDGCGLDLDMVNRLESVDHVSVSELSFHTVGMSWRMALSRGGLVAWAELVGMALRLVVFPGGARRSRILSVAYLARTRLKEVFLSSRSEKILWMLFQW